MYKKRLVFWSACIGMLLFGIGLITLGSIAPDLKVKLQLSEISSGALFSILPFGILTGSLLFGPVVDKYGYKILMAVSCVLLFAGFEGIAYAQSAGVLKIFVFLIGFGGGVVNGATNALVADISDKDKGANLSLLGVFFGVGALGMPLILGILENRISFEVIIASVGLLALMAGIFFILIRFPPPKQAQGLPLTQSFALIKDKVLILIAFFLFFQSSFEGIINNWTTTYLINQLSIPQSQALFALSSFVAGMIVMRLLIGTVFRSVPVRKILIVSFSLILISLLIIKTGNSYFLVIAGLVLLGAGLAGGFPIMLGFIGSRFAGLSGTAFSFALFIALLGNMLINYLMGVISQNFGINHLITVAFGESVIMIFLCIVIMKKLKN
ncbi:MAG: MFS transporter [Bacteroidales bacterium]|nr:MFS transporter [Bacteroidales bacterium]